MDTHRFDVAVSFAGSDRQFVESIVRELKSRQISVFYDDDYQPEIWGQNLIEYFEQIYLKDARYAVMFVSAAYAERMWTTHERRTILLRATSQASPYALPVRLDETELPGLSAAVGYLDARRVGSAGIVGAIISKLGALPDKALPVIRRTPRSELELAELLAVRPEGWEYMQLAAELHIALERSEPTYQDYEIGYFPLGESVPAERILSRLSDAMDQSASMMTRFNAVMSQQAQHSAVGRPGEEGNPQKIHHLAQRWNEGYVELMNCSARVLSWRVDDECVQMMRALSRFTEQSVESYRAFVHDLVSTADGIPTAVAKGETLAIRMEITFDIDNIVIQEYEREFAAFRRRTLQ